MMDNSRVRISKEIASDVFARAAQLYAQENQNYSLEELIQAGAEVQIPPEFIQQALQQIRAQQTQAREQQQKLKLILISGGIGSAITLCSLFAYNAIANHFTQARRMPDNHLGIADLRNANRQDSPNPIITQPLPPELPREDVSTWSGVIQQYLLNPEGKVDGLLLKNGLQVTFPPHMGDSLVAMVSPGTQVTIAGIPGVTTRFGQEVKAQTITNSQTRQTLVEQPPAVPPQPPSLSNYSTLFAEGVAQHWLVGRRGDLNGVIVSDGTIVRFPPHVGNQLINTANVGDKIQAQGFGTRNRYGQIIQATTLTINGQSVSLEPNSFTGP